METKILSPKEGLEKAAQLIKDGQVVGIPTETVYGLGANALDKEAVLKIFAAKGRPADNPLIVHIGQFSDLEGLTDFIPLKAKKLADKFWPGPLTMIFKSNGRVPKETTGGLDTVAVRFPSHPTANALIRLSGLPIAAPSANTSGKPSPTDANHVFHDMKGKIPLIIDGGESDVGVESTVISMVTDPPLLLRPGGVTVEQIRQTIGEIDIDPSVEHNIQIKTASSPGMKYKHYSPSCKVILIHSDVGKFTKFVNQNAGPRDAAICFDEDAAGLSLPVISLGRADDRKAHAHRLFAALREVDDGGFDRVFAHCPPTDGVGLAVFNRLVRAAGFDERWL